ncbi:hypothetical protein [Klebsiella aerogenes EA1509E]|nr:hypothetical protein [Klebsiella aerogenes EA1509E]
MFKTKGRLSIAQARRLRRAGEHFMPTLGSFIGKMTDNIAIQMINNAHIIS